MLLGGGALLALGGLPTLFPSVPPGPSSPLPIPPADEQPAPDEPSSDRPADNEPASDEPSSDPATPQTNADAEQSQGGDAPIDPVTGRPMVAWPGNETQVGVADPAPAGRRLTLTERELQVLRGMADGKSNAEIGRELFLAEGTVKAHVAALLDRLGVANRVGAAVAAHRAGLV